MNMKTYQSHIRSLLSPAQRRIFARLNSPQEIQTFLDSFPVRVGREHTMHGPTTILKERRAHCMEGAMLAAAILAYHGRPPLLLDITTTGDDFDHVVTLFKDAGRWGAISKTNYPVLRWRDPVYKTVRELAMSYFHEIFLNSGRKTMRSYSAPFDLRKFKPEEWITAKGNLDWVAEELEDSPHSPIALSKLMKNLRRASSIEIKATALREWDKRGKHS
ncbi:MAG: hypothetical protein KGI70_01610 [Patescibacteria group bacterium]|nr:hypothetical protein [Patescibacteria group bacterium]